MTPQTLLRILSQYPYHGTNKAMDVGKFVDRDVYVEIPTGTKNLKRYTERPFSHGFMYIYKYHAIVFTLFHPDGFVCEVPVTPDKVHLRFVAVSVGEAIHEGSLCDSIARGVDPNKIPIDERSKRAAMRNSMRKQFSDVPEAHPNTIRASFKSFNLPLFVITDRYMISPTGTIRRRSDEYASS